MNASEQHLIYFMAETYDKRTNDIFTHNGEIKTIAPKILEIHTK
jgi:hypothetical protein